MIKDAPQGVSGVGRTLAEDTKLEENSCCGVGKGIMGVWAQPEDRALEEKSCCLIVFVGFIYFSLKFEPRGT